VIARRLQVRGQHGLSLLEVLVALAIMAISLTVLYRVTGGSLKAVLGADLRTRAILQAESVLAQKSVVPPDGWQETGERDGMRWSVQSSVMLPGSASGQFPAMHRVAVDVSWPGVLHEQHFQLVSVLPESRPARTQKP
jgi:general secretion pathway protein I